jgi:hypothetical protein
VSGQVLTEQGQPAPHIEVIATLTRLFEPPEGSAHPDVEGLEWITRTNAAGAFRLVDLFDGEYSLRTRESHAYPGSTSTTIRAGADDVKLVVVQQRDIWIDGYVVDPQGQPLGDVWVSPGHAAEPGTASDAGGGFSFLLTVRSDRTEVLTLRAEGYREQRISISRNDWFDRQQVELTVTMQPEMTRASVSGWVQSSEGRPVVGEQVYLQRAQQKYRATTDETGGFLIPEVEIGGGYILWLVPRTGYRDFRQEGIKVPSAGLNDLRIILDPLDVGRLSGRLLDTAGNPVPNFTLLIRTGAASVPVTSDGAGFFAVDDVPEGPVQLETNSFPRLITSGIQLPAGGEAEVVALLDIGNQQVSGRVIDDRGAPVAGANVTLSWTQRQPPLLHESLRQSVSAADGGFLFTRLGAVPHQIIVQAPGFLRAELGAATGGRVDVRLMPDEG